MYISGKRLDDAGLKGEMCGITIVFGNRMVSGI